MVDGLGLAHPANRHQLAQLMQSRMAAPGLGMTSEETMASGLPMLSSYNDPRLAASQLAGGAMSQLDFLRAGGQLPTLNMIPAQVPSLMGTIGAASPSQSLGGQSWQLLQPGAYQQPSQAQAGFGMFPIAAAPMTVGGYPFSVVPAGSLIQLPGGQIGILQQPQPGGQMGFLQQPQSAGGQISFLQQPQSAGDLMGALQQTQSAGYQMGALQQPQPLQQPPPSFLRGHHASRAEGHDDRKRKARDDDCEEEGDDDDDDAYD